MSIQNAEQGILVEAEVSQDDKIYLYHVSASMDGDSLDLYVRAHTPEQAARFMYRYYELPVVQTSTDKPPRIFCMLETSGSLGPIDWNDVEQWTAKVRNGRIAV